MKDEASVSVIIPAYNGSAHLEETLACVFRQSHAATEVLVVDDGSTDDTAAVVGRFGGKAGYFHKTNGGVASARNEGIRRATGDFLALLDQDDWWPDDRLETTVAAFAQDPRRQVVMGLSEVVFEEGGLRGKFGLPEAQLTAPHPLVGSALFRRTAFETVGLFNEGLRASDDIDWFNRAREVGLPLVVLPSVTLYHRRHAANTSNDTSWLRSETMRAMKLSLDRRRKRANAGSIPPLGSFIEKP